MFVTDLSHEQRLELKEAYLMQLFDEGLMDETEWGDKPSYLALACADELIDDGMLDEHFDGITFTNDDFFCTAGKE